MIQQGGDKMWISKRRLENMENRIADLEREVQSQRNVLDKHFSNHKQENEEIKEIFDSIKREIYKGIQQIS